MKTPSSFRLKLNANEIRLSFPKRVVSTSRPSTGSFCLPGPIPVSWTWIWKVQNVLNEQKPTFKRDLGNNDSASERKHRNAFQSKGDETSLFSSKLLSAEGQGAAVVEFFKFIPLFVFFWLLSLDLFGCFSLRFLLLEENKNTRMYTVGFI